LFLLKKYDIIFIEIEERIDIDMIDWTKDSDGYIVLYKKEKLSNGQTFIMDFSEYDYTADTLYVNIGVQVYRKRKKRDSEYNSCLVTSGVPAETAFLGMKSFRELEQIYIDAANKHWSDKYKNIIFTVYWTDNRRRDVYYKFLKKYGYEYGMIHGYKGLYKKVVLNGR
jgi:hypothetical protein